MAMRRLLLLYVAAAAALELKFEAWDGGYVRVSNADVDDLSDEAELECKSNAGYVVQLDPDSVLVEGAVSGRPSPLADYGVGPAPGQEDTPDSAFERLVFKSGMFIPELDPCWFSTQKGGNVPFTQRTYSGMVCNGYADAWYKYVAETDFVGNYDSQNYADGPPGEGVKHLKYAPTGALNLREAGSANANIKVYSALSKLNPFQRDGSSDPFVTFNRMTRSMWGICDGQACASIPITREGYSAFPGMMPTLHPVFDGLYNWNDANCGNGDDCYSNPTHRENKIHRERTAGNVVAREQARLAVKRCPDATNNECCLAIEGDATDVELEKVSWLAETATVTDRTEYKLRWRTAAVHTSFSRGVPDQRFYTPTAVRADVLARRNNPMINSKVLTEDGIANLMQFHGYSQNEAVDKGFSALYPDHNSENDSPLRNHSGSSSKCSLIYKSKVDFRMAFYLEHYYTALVGVEEKRALAQANVFEKYDRKRYADEVKEDDMTAEEAHHEACGNMPGGHCGHGYSCNRQNSKHRPHDLIECMPTNMQFEQDENYKFANRENFGSSVISGQYHGLADSWNEGTLVAQKVTEDNKNLFRNRVRGRPELVQWYQDEIAYSGNRGKPRFGSDQGDLNGLLWPCEWPPPDRDHRWCDFRAVSSPSKQNPNSLDAENYCVWVTDWRNGGKDRYVCKPTGWPSACSKRWPPNWPVGETPSGCPGAPDGCKSDADINPNGGGKKYYNCVDLDYEFKTRQSYMSYGESYYPHALDALSLGLVGLTLPYRMSARDIFTYGANRGFNGEYSSNRERNPYFARWESMLPCRGERGVGRSCYNMKATKWEWLLASQVFKLSIHVFNQLTPLTGRHVPESRVPQQSANLRRRRGRQRGHS